LSAAPAKLPWQFVSYPEGVQVSEAQTEKISFPYMSAAQWYGIRAKLRQSKPNVIGVDWVMSALGGSEKGAKNLLPQLRSIGIIGDDGKPTPLALDLRDDEQYGAACQSILESLYPETLRHAYDDPEADVQQVANWFMRNAHTGELTARMQARLYLTVLKGELPSESETPKPRKRGAKKAAAAAAAAKTVVERAVGGESKVPAATANGSEETLSPVVSAVPSTHQSHGPTLHIDLQIHISADASDTQIDAVFKSMAKHLYGRD
jgi:hypothetical protein